MTKGRLEAFSDGVIAIIITITILLIDLPKGDDLSSLMAMLALLLTFVPGAHYASCPLLVVALAPWIIPDLRMKRVFEAARRGQEGEGV